jgi:hypothetical protein
MKTQFKWMSLAIANATLISLAGCGGGDDAPATSSTPTDGSPTAVVTTPPVVVTTPTAVVTTPTTVVTTPTTVVSTPTVPAFTTVTLTGFVMQGQGVKNAVVCMDLNANNVCDTTEPKAAKTGADGAYSLSYNANDIATAQVAAASLIAPMVPGLLTDPNATVDADDPTATNTQKAFVLKQVPGKSGQINPLTTMVALGMAGGMTEAVARTNLALQLGITAAKIDNYQDDPVITLAAPTARLMAKMAFATMEDGTPVLADQSAAVVAANGDMRSLRYTDAANYSFLTFNTLAKPAGTPGRSIEDFRSGLTAGVATASLYNQAYLTPAGWVRCDASVPLITTAGSPSRTTFCNAQDSVGFTVPTDVAGTSMVSLVNAMQTDGATNSINNGLTTTNLLTALGTATFPTGSATTLRTTLNVTQPIFINSLNTDGFSQATTATLEQLIANRPASGVNLPNVGTSFTLGLGSGNLKNLRVAFTGVTNTTTGTVQFYECDLNAALTIASNCATTTAGTYTISTVHGARVMRFAGHAPTVMNHTRGFAEVKNVPSVIGGDWVFIVRETKTDVDSNLSKTKRLNATAFAAMRTKLGI